MDIVNGLKWSIEQAQIVSAFEFQSDDGEPMAGIKLAYFGGLQTIMVKAEDMHKFKKYEGQIVSCSGELFIEIKKTGAKVNFGIKEIKPHNVVK